MSPAASGQVDGSCGSSWRALGTSVVLRVTEPAAMTTVAALVAARLGAVDRACSRFRTDSDLARVNASGGRPVEVSSLLVEAVDVALRAARLSDGDVDPTVGAHLILYGYDRDWSLLRDARDGGDLRGGCAPVLRAHARVGWQAVAVDRRAQTVCVPPGVQLDLGATAKAWAADSCARLAAQRGGVGVLVALGGDIATAGPSPAGGWPIRVTDDHRSERGAHGQTVWIRSGGLATSGVTVRRWSHAGRAVHHIIDPATGVSAGGPWRTVSVVAADCTDANIASTASIVRGHRALDWLAGVGLPARLVDRRGHVRSVGGWPHCDREPVARHPW